MILRAWSARATTEGAERYVRYFRESLLATLQRLEGQRGATVLTRPAGDEVEVTVLTLWDSLDAIRRFAGPEPTVAVVEDEARAMLLRFDGHVTHADVRLDARS
ncbi:MAG TPA: hypothetical protein VFX14_21190 [Methylomirabilota bacterium]|nr:hypothetical protein [Methylomirabilota bacterium]